MSSWPQRGVVTPEAVLLEFETASVGSRSLARAIDLGVQLGAFLVVAVVVSVFAPGTSLAGPVTVIVITVAIFVILFGYPVWMETRYGRTLGKMAMGLRVMTTEGMPVRFRHAAVRSALNMVDVFAVPLGVIGVLSVLVSRQNQRLGDLAAGTVVLRDRSGALGSVAVAFPPPPGWEPYVAGLDVRSLTPEQYGLVRAFLLRVFALSPAARSALAVRLATPVARAIRHTPPPGVHPELFLVCVAAAYQGRYGPGATPPPASVPPAPAAGLPGPPGPNPPGFVAPS